MHALARGDAVDDAVLFRSEKCHNVATREGQRGAGGVRRSLVVELWSADTNLKNRYS